MQTNKRTEDVIPTLFNAGAGPGFPVGGMDPFWGAWTFDAGAF